jgi:hypothetical protein
MPNYNPETGVRYGVIYLNSLDGDIAAELFDIARDDMCATCEENNEDEEGGSICDCCDPEVHGKGSYDGIEFIISCLGGAPLMWVTKSPHISYREALCSPCVPNGGDLGSPRVSPEEGHEMYDVPDSWRVEGS